MKKSKKVLNRTAGFVLCFVMVLSLLRNTISVLAADQQTADAGESDMDIAIDSILTIDAQLEEKDTSVQEQLALTEKEYRSLLRTKTNITEQNKIEGLIEANHILSESYAKYQAYQKYGAPIDPNDIYRAAVAAVCMYFGNNGYVLARELLTHALVAEKDSTYLPEYGPQRIGATFQFYLVVISENANASGVFEDEGTVVSRDCKYAIHKFDYAKLQNNEIMFADYYDFGEIDGYNFMEAAAIANVKMAMRLGIINPYHVWSFVSY